MSTHHTQLRNEFNQWAEAGRGDGMRSGHWDMTIQTIEKMELQGHESVLDLGCGNGWAVRELAERLPRGRAAGIDISDKMIAEAREKYADLPQIDFFVSSAEKLPFLADEFDHVLSVESFYYYPALEPVLEELDRVLKPGGQFWCLVDLYKENKYSMTWPDQLDVPVHALGESDYRNLFKEAGFHVVLQERVVDRRPIEKDRFKPGWGTPTFEDYQGYKSLGSLLTVAQKSAK